MRAPAFQPEWHNALMSDKERGYAHRVDIRADPQEVWRAFTEAEQLKGWCSPDAEIRAGKGGLFRASVDRVTEFEAHIDVFEPGRRLRLIYLPPSGQQAIIRLKVVVERQAGPGATP